MKRSGGFSLMEMLVVLALVSLIVLLLPQGFGKLFARSSLDSVAHSMAAKLRDCARQAQLQQRILKVGWESKDCALEPIPDFQLAFENSVAPVFYDDGSSNGSGLIVEQAGEQLYVSVNRLTADINVSGNVRY